MTGIVLAAAAIYVTVVLFQIQDAQSRLERESRVARISFDTDVDSHPSGVWLASIHLLNSGPSPADFVKIEVGFGSAGLEPPAGAQVEIDPPGRGRATSTGLRLINAKTIQHPICIYTVDIERWQVGEQINVRLFLRLQQGVQDLLTQEEVDANRSLRTGNLEKFTEQQDALRGAFIPRVFIYESPNVRAINQRDKINDLFNRGYVGRESQLSAAVPRCEP